jgi:hypothetical protein
MAGPAPGGLPLFDLPIDQRRLVMRHAWRDETPPCREVITTCDALRAIVDLGGGEARVERACDEEDFWKARCAAEGIFAQPAGQEATRGWECTFRKMCHNREEFYAACDFAIAEFRDRAELLRVVGARIEEPLRDAVDKDDVGAVQALLATGAVYLSHVGVENFIERAAAEGRVSMVVGILAYAGVHARTHGTWMLAPFILLATALQSAATAGRAATIAAVLAAEMPEAGGPDLDSPASLARDPRLLGSALIAAARGGSLRAVEAILLAAKGFGELSREDEATANMWGLYVQEALEAATDGGGGAASTEIVGRLQQAARAVEWA